MNPKAVYDLFMKSPPTTRGSSLKDWFFRGLNNEVSSEPKEIEFPCIYWAYKAGVDSRIKT
jgi:hypothetical protein